MIVEGHRTESLIDWPEAVVRSVPVGLPNDKREQFLRSVCDLWIAETGCSMNEIIVTAWDGPIPGA